jgi:hypothetical protein
VQERVELGWQRCRDNAGLDRGGHI